VRPDRERDQRGGGAEGGAGDAVVAAPGAVLALDLGEAGSHLLAPGGEVVAARDGLGFGDQHVRDVLFAAVAAESAHHPLVREL